MVFNENQIPDEFYKDMKNNLQDNILIDFFLTIGLPDHFICSCFKTIDKKFNGDLNTPEVKNWLKKEIDSEIKMDKTMI